MKLSAALSLVAALASAAPALAVSVWQQCGVCRNSAECIYYIDTSHSQGIGYSGSTACDAGSACVYLNDCELRSSRKSLLTNQLYFL